MVYAYDQWALLPVKDLYDSQIMLASINAAKDMYEKGLLEMKDFKKEYGDFYSPISGDNDWYAANVTNRVAEGVNALYANGIDPFRSAEGRAAVTRLINSVPTGELTKKRAAAEKAKQYIKSRDLLIASGMFDPNYERYMLGGQLLEEWDGSLGDWKATAASPYTDLNRRYTHLFDKMEKKIDWDESKKHPGWIIKRKSEQDMRKILDSSMPDIMNNPQYQYDLSRTKGVLQQQYPNLSENDLDNLARRSLTDQIISRNLEVDAYDAVPDQMYLERMKEAAADRRLTKQLNRSYPLNPSNQGGVMPFTTRLQATVFGTNKEQSNAKSTQHAYVETATGISAIIDHYKKKVFSIKKLEWEKANPNAYKKLENDPATYSSPGAAYQQQVMKYKKRDYTKEQQAFDVSKNKTAQGYEREIKYWEDVMAGKKELDLNKYNKLLKSGAGSLNYKDTRQLANYLYHQYTAPFANQAEANASLNRFAGYNVKEKLANNPNAPLTFDFGGYGVHYSPIRHLTSTTNRLYRHNSIESTFDRWLHSRKPVGRIFNQETYAGMLNPNGRHLQLDDNGYAAISKNDLLEFEKYLEKRNVNYGGSLKSLVDRLGLIPRQLDTTRKDDDDNYITDTYYEVPVTRTIENTNGLVFSEIDKDIMGNLFTKDKAYGEAPRLELLSLMNQ